MQPETPFRITTRDLNHASIAMALGYSVEVYRQPAGKRALFSFADAPELNRLIEAYERKECLPIPTKAVINARTTLYYEVAKVMRGEEL